MTSNDPYESTPVVLFDVDGTLTGHRRKIERGMIRALLDLARLAQLGFVTGSSFTLIEEQLSPFFSADNASIAEAVDIFPCNGTQYFFWDSADGKFVLGRSVSMRNEIGDSSFWRLMISLQECQLDFINRFAVPHDIPLCGNFIEYRDSLLNWCPIGRVADFDDREKFIGLDLSLGIRKQLMSELTDKISGIPGIVVNFGGQTSFDIFPTGWDKTFCLNTYSNATVWFVGDRCEPGGNDFEIFDLLEPTGRAYKTRSPSETIRIIEKKIVPDVKQFLLTQD